MPRLLDKHPTGGAFSLSAADQPALLCIRPLRGAHIRTHMSRIETADCAVSLDVIFDICDALEIKPVELFDFRA